MRRRLWHFLVQLDYLASFHVGLPAMVSAIESDTALPHNLRDDDFGEDSTTIPPGRPETELTPMSYVLSKGRIILVFGKVVAFANRLVAPPYSELLVLNEALDQASNKVATPLRMVPLHLAITDANEVIIQRFMIATLYQKTRCVLHRRYITSAPGTETFLSKQIALEAATQLLDYQSQICDAVQPNGLLSKETWFINSLAVHDFLLAATMIYLALSLRTVGSEERDSQCRLFNAESLMGSLRRSRDVWQMTEGFLKESRKPSRVIEFMLRRLNAQTPSALQASGWPYAMNSFLFDQCELQNSVVTVVRLESTANTIIVVPALSQSTSDLSLSKAGDPAVQVTQSSLVQDDYANVLDMDDAFDWVRYADTG